MKSADVLRILNISRPTLTKYVKNGTIKVSKMANGFYDYDESSVYKFLNEGNSRFVYCYIHNETIQPDNEHNMQLGLIKDYCNRNGIVINKILQDTNDDIELADVLSDIIDGKVSKLIITSIKSIPLQSENLINMILSKGNTQLIEVLAENI